MKISLSKNSEVPLWQQLSEQMVFLITTGQLRVGQQLPSVRTLARQAKVHHNTVSEAYQDLVRRQWLSGHRGRRLVVGVQQIGRNKPSNLDELMNETIQRAAEMGYTLQALTDRVRQRLLTAPPDHIWVVEEETELRAVICHEIARQVQWSVRNYSLSDFLRQPQLAANTQVFAPAHLIKQIEPLVPANRPAIAIVYSDATQHLKLIRQLKKPSVIATVSASESLLKTARGLFAPVIGRRHTLHEVLLVGHNSVDLAAADLAFCDSLAIESVRCRHKVHYQLVTSQCLSHLQAVLRLPSEVPVRR
jgi:GntR family transcriptional regulator